MLQLVKNKLFVLFGKQSQHYRDGIFKHNTLSLLILAIILWLEQALYCFVFTDPALLIGKVHLFTSILSFFYLICFAIILKNNRLGKNRHPAIDFFEFSYIAILIIIAIFRANVIPGSDFSIPVIYIALLYGSAFLLFYPPRWSLLLYGVTAIGFIISSRSSILFLNNATLAQDVIFNNLFAWAASVLAYYRFTRQVDATQLIEEKNAELKTLSEIDAMTGLYNRRKLDEFLIKLHLEAKNAHTNYVLILADIDFFKRVNDQFGHPIGDYVIQSTAHILKSFVQPTDVIGRFGGEEFLIICKDTSFDEANAIAEEMRNAISAHDFGIPMHITCSIGISGYSESMTSQRVVQNADRALYMSKNNGKNRVTLLAG